MVFTRLLSCNVSMYRPAAHLICRNNCFRDTQIHVVAPVVFNRRLYQMDKQPEIQSTGGGGSCKTYSGVCPPDGGMAPLDKKWMILAALAALAGLGALVYVATRKKQPVEQKELPPTNGLKIPASSKDLPKHVPYLLVGGGSASFSAFRAIKSNDPTAKVLIITDELFKPYMRPPLSKELWYASKPGDVPQNYRFKQWTGAERSLFFEPEEFFTDPVKLVKSVNGGVAVAQGYVVKKVDPTKKIVTLSDNTEITYDKCLLATGCTPRNIQLFEDAPTDIQRRIMFYKTPVDFEKLKKFVDEQKSITIVGNGFLGSELCCSLASYANGSVRITQVFPESGNMSKILPEYLSKWTTRKIEQLGVCVLPGVHIVEVHREKCRLKLSLSNGQILITDVVVVCLGCDANTKMAPLSGLEVDNDLGGFVTNAELETRQDLFAAGDVVCFYDPLLGRRRLEHHDHSIISGRLAGENMTLKDGKKKPYDHQSMYWSDLGPDIGYEGIGRTDSALPTVGIFAIPTPVVRETTNLDPVETPPVNLNPEGKKDVEVYPPICKTPDISRCEEREYGKGVIFYLDDDKIVGILLWNLFNRIGLARTIIKENKHYSDLNDLAKLFEIHS